ncbi:unnamed protein product, partial [Adineta steineri]
MHPKILFRWLYNKVCDYNLFMLDDNEYNDDDDEPEEPTTVLKKQKYTTWLYALFLMGNGGVGLDAGTCERDNPMVTTMFTLYSGKLFTIDMRKELRQWIGSPYIEGFFAGCTPLEGLLNSTLDCFYDIKCVQLLADYFPTLNQSNISLMDSILVPPKQNKTVYDHLHTLFIDEWSIDVNYSKYYGECAPTSCTYTIIDPINFSSAFTLLIGIYGGLIIILRLITPFLVNMSMKFNCYLRNRGVHLCSLLILIIFTSLSTQTVTITESNPSLMTYDRLQAMYSSTLKCPCSNTVIRYDTFMSLFPTLHQVCSSGFIHDSFLSVLNGKVFSGSTNDWTNRAFSHFQLLMDLCRLANETSKAAVDRFIMRFIVISNVLNENDFNTQINVTLDQFYQSTIADFRFAVDIQRLFVQIDQPYTGKAPTGIGNDVTDLIVNRNMAYSVNNQPSQ